MRAAIYSRKSKFTPKGESIENQIQLCKEYAFANLHIQDEQIAVYEDEGFSGGNTDRPQFQQLIKDAKARCFDVLICYRLDRISRNVADFSALMETFERFGIGFISIRERFDTTTPMGRAMLYISSVFAQLERETIAERVRDNMMQLSRTGRWLGGVKPTGYDVIQSTFVDSSGKTKTLYRLDIIEQEAELVRSIYRKFLEFKSLTKLESDCLIQGVLSKNGNPMKIDQVRYMLSNPVYCMGDEKAYDFLSCYVGELCDARDAYDGRRGLMPYHRTTKLKRNSQLRNNHSEWVIALGEHRGIVDSETWIAVQELLMKNKTNGYPKARKTHALLTGLLRCSACGSRMRPKSEKKTGGFYYVCDLKEKSRKTRCQMNNANGMLLDQEVYDQIRAMVPTISDRSRDLRANVECIVAGRSDLDSRIKALEHESSSLSLEIERLASSIAHTSDAATIQVIVQQIDEREALRRHQAAELERLKGRGAEDEQRENEQALIGELLSAYAESGDAIPKDELFEMLRVFTENIVWDGKKASIELMV